MPNKYNVPDTYVRKKYKRDFIQKVISRIDFDVELQLGKGGPPEALYKVIKERFPITETREIVGKEFVIGPGDTKEKSIAKKEWFYFGKEREKYIIITPEFIAIEYSKYDYFEKLEEDFISATNAVFDAFPGVKIKRLGLRYVDEINLKEEDPVNWEKYFKSELISNINLATEKSKLSRVFSVIEINYGDAILKFQYGIINGDYPAAIRKKAFILDYDMYTSVIVEHAEIKEKLNEFHTKLGHSFEEVITDNLRTIMEPING